MFKIPYSVLPTKVLRDASSSFMGIGSSLQELFPFLKLYLKQAESDLSAKEYLSMCFLSSIIFFAFFGVFLTLILASLGIEKSFLFGLITAMIITFFVFLQQLIYPKVYANKRVRDIEKNLIVFLMKKKYG